MSKLSKSDLKSINELFKYGKKELAIQLAYGQGMTINEIVDMCLSDLWLYNIDESYYSLGGFMVHVKVNYYYNNMNPWALSPTNYGPLSNVPLKHRTLAQEVNKIKVEYKRYHLSLMINRYLDTDKKEIKIAELLKNINDE